MAALSYKTSGVNIDEADIFIRRIKPMVKSTSRPEVMGTLGGFSGLFAPRIKGMKKPVLVSSTDGVGTKIMIAEAQKKYDTVGIDLVAMSVDDVVVLGAEPLFFLDYIAIGKLDTNQLAQVMKGIVRGCKEAGCALVGGETAELPGLYAPGKWESGGFLRRSGRREEDHRRSLLPSGRRAHRPGLLGAPQQRIFPGPEGFFRQGYPGGNRP